MVAMLDGYVQAIENQGELGRRLPHDRKAHFGADGAFDDGVAGLALGSYFSEPDRFAASFSARPTSKPPHDGPARQLVHWGWLLYPWQSGAASATPSLPHLGNRRAQLGKNDPE